ncbi:hypothetical protein PB2503_07117 [Parvularcula bermudensis HTCC2503]|uniref:SPOR domain-containing protein n=1 Tax=Parvularcula bermudensis (strain ATCC BAA-594 / HTCC2503 / KCTC 12087) TaxID=314260 RepID=E0TEB4_PARBH|nr:SPOR domain-containing protein [Parvularcula bermudensis]ADM09489.1 hypothetical protein PB2503_07117 [Parvularcula bermudensis HTCC2503]
MSTTALSDEGYDDFDEGGLSGFWVLVIALVMLTAFAGIVYLAYQKGRAEVRGDGALPTVTADPRPLREAVSLEPAEGGAPREVFDELNDERSAIVIADENPSEDALNGYSSSGPTGASTTAAGAAPQAQPQAQPTTPTQNVASADPSPRAPSPAPARSAAPTREATPTPAPATRPSTSSTSSSSPAAATGPWAVQVGAFGSRDEAMEVYGRLSRQIGSLVANQSPDINVAVVNGTTYYRLLLGGFASKGAADVYCRDLSAKGQDCFTRKR